MPASLHPFVDIVSGALLQSAWQGALVTLTVAVTLATWPMAPAARYGVAISGLVLTSVTALVAIGRGAVPALSGTLAWGLTACWLAGFTILSIRLAGGWWFLRRCLGEPRAAAWESVIARFCQRLGMSADVTVVESSMVPAPGLVGWRRPVIVLPHTTLAAARPHEVEAILAHELAHVRRHDWAANLLQAVIETLFFFHPGVWWLSRRVRVEREYCCDDIAAALHDDPLRYAEALLSLERQRGPDRRPAPKADLPARIRRLADAPTTATTRLDAWTPVVGFNVTLAVCWWAVHAGAATAALPTTAFATLGRSLPTGAATLLVGSVLGLLLGMRHACEPDHLLAVSTLMSTERGAARATRLGVSWGVGHTLSLLGVGAGLAVVHVELPGGVTDVCEFAVSLMLVALGGRAIYAAWRHGTAGPIHSHAHGSLTHEHAGAREHLHVGRWTLASRPLMVGMVHGLAGSGALTALVMANLPSVSSQIAYIVVFGAGSTVSMAALTACAGWPIARFARRPSTLATLSYASGLLSIGYGVLSGSPVLWLWLNGVAAR